MPINQSQDELVENENTSQDVSMNDGGEGYANISGVENNTMMNNSFAEFRFGSIGRSVPFDPFLRTRNVPFHVAGRRRSISVFNTIDG